MRKGKPFGTSFKPTECQLQITRREFCQSTATVALASRCSASHPCHLSPGVAALAETVPTADLMKPDALPDMALGNDKAPVTIVEYASMTCPHCAHFQETTFPELKKRYIDTGKVRYIFREFPLDKLAAAAFMLARCAGKGDNDQVLSRWSTRCSASSRAGRSKKPVPPLIAIAKQAGFTEADFQRLPRESEAARRHRKRAPARHEPVQGAVDADIFHQRRTGMPAPSRSRKWPR